MHAASLERSPRLRRVADLLADGGEHSTLDIVRLAQVCAVNSIIAELRANGLAISCRTAADERGRRVWLYRLAPPDPHEHEPPPAGSERAPRTRAPRALRLFD